MINWLERSKVFVELFILVFKIATSHLNRFCFIQEAEQTGFTSEDIQVHKVHMYICLHMYRHISRTSRDNNIVISIVGHFKKNLSSKLLNFMLTGIPLFLSPLLSHSLFISVSIFPSTYIYAYLPIYLFIYLIFGLSIYASVDFYLSRYLSLY